MSNNTSKVITVTIINYFDINTYESCRIINKNDISYSCLKILVTKHLIIKHL